MENACTHCYDLVLHHKHHSELRKISELKGSELYKCCFCHAYLHKHNNEWEIISGGSFTGTPPNNNSINIDNSLDTTERSSANTISHQH
ncbi:MULTISPECIES: hypothetical protein [unclassified Neptuniibacter]|uniref:hypothetical protein n=1 Tax=unclassified Neptuniibacter TaxID=2630693 RepID=UPI0025D5313B|nr:MULTISPECIES: hypothetical protein [unclassified Neptuniibacter]